MLLQLLTEFQHRKRHTDTVGGRACRLAQLQSNGLIGTQIVAFTGDVRSRRIAVKIKSRKKCECLAGVTTYRACLVVSTFMKSSVALTRSKEYGKVTAV